MKKIALIISIVIMVFALGCNDSKAVSEGTVDTSGSVEGEGKVENGIEEEELYVNIKVKGSKRFLDKGVEFQSKLEGNNSKELQYKWTVEYSVEQGDNLIDGLVGEEGPVTEIVNDGEPVAFGIYAEVSYIPGAYSERKVKLQVLDKESGEVLAEDEVIIENHEGMYIVNTTKNEKLFDKILKTSNARLYGKMIDEVWKIDSALNSGISYINVDTRTFESFNEEDKKQLFEYLSEQYDAEILDMSMDELEEAGYIKDLYFPEGIIFSIDKYIINSEDKISLEGRKWASGTGAIGFIFEAEKEKNEWKIKKCDMTWIS